jgi:16S rRNA (adenine1518-N6/adenine1519-N6)-dimethyltransferase
MTDPVAKKSLGQHWLTDTISLRAMCTAAGVEPGDTVLEIGPGFGTLTEQLIVVGAHVTALEFDVSLIPSLEKKFKPYLGTQLAVEPGDIRTFDFTTMPPNYKVVANIPYYLTSNLIQLLSETTNPPSTAVLLVQKEVAIRVASTPGNMSILSITAQYYWDVELDMVVRAELFRPAPKVDSQIMVLTYRTTPRFKDVDPKRFFQIVKAGFSQKRKTLLNSLSAGLRIDREATKVLCDKSGINAGLRAQALSLEDWHKLYLSLEV